MTKRRVRRKPAKVVEPEVEEEVLEVEDEDEDFEEDELEEKPAPKRRRRRKAAPKAAVEEEDELEEEPAPRRRRKAATKELDVEEETTLVGQANDLSQILGDLVEAGHVIVIRKVGRSVAFHKAGIVGAITKSSGKSVTAITRKRFEEIAYSPEFNAFHPEWTSYTYEEKVELAQAEKVKWERHENPKVDVMRLTAAVRKARGIDKWRPEYSTRSARDMLLKQGIRADPVE